MRRRRATAIAAIVLALSITAPELAAPAGAGDALRVNRSELQARPVVTLDQQLSAAGRVASAHSKTKKKNNKKKKKHKKKKAGSSSGWRHAALWLALASMAAIAVFLIVSSLLAGPRARARARDRSRPRTPVSS